MTKLIVGIGNPGKEYENTRHNIGFIVLDNYLSDINWKKEHNSMVVTKTFNNEKVIFIKPLTFVNESGLETSYFKNYYHVENNDIMVIHDDVSLPLGKIRMKINSSSGGHNGIKSIISQIGGTDFIQLKVGISLNDNIELKDYVLGKFTKEEKEVIDNIKKITTSILEELLSGTSLDELMNRFN